LHLLERERIHIRLRNLQRLQLAHGHRELATIGRLLQDLAQDHHHGVDARRRQLGARAPTAHRRQVRAELQDLGSAHRSDGQGAEVRQQVLVENAAHGRDVGLAPADLEFAEPQVGEGRELGVISTMAGMLGAKVVGNDAATDVLAASSTKPIVVSKARTSPDAESVASTCLATRRRCSRFAGESDSLR
jgi:hypothetical protein